MLPSDELPRPRADAQSAPQQADCFVSAIDSLTIVVRLTMDGATNHVNAGHD